MKRRVVLETDLGDTTRGGLFRARSDEWKKAEEKRLREFLVFVADFKRPRIDIVQTDELSVGTKVVVKYTDGTVNVDLQKEFDKLSFKDVTRVGLTSPLRDEFIIENMSEEDVIKGRTSSLTSLIVLCCLVIIALCFYLLLLVNPDRYSFFSN